MASQKRPRAQVLPRLAAAVGVLAFVSGSVLVFFTQPPGEKLASEPDLPVPVKSSIQVSSDSRTPHDLLPEKVTPSTSTHAPVSPKPRGALSVPATAAGKPTTRPVVSPPGGKKPTPKPSPRPSQTTTYPTPTPTPTPSPTVLHSHTADLINAKRVAAGLNSLTVNADLTFQAQRWSERMAQTGDFRHSVDPVLGEIIGQGYTTAEQVVAAWEASPPHREIMYGPYGKIGVGAANPGWYWTVQFG